MPFILAFDIEDSLTLKGQAMQMYPFTRRCPSPKASLGQGIIHYARRFFI